MANAQKTISIKDAIKNITERKITIIKTLTNDVADNFLDKLRTSIAQGGCSAYDKFRYTYGKAYSRRYRQHSYARWTGRDRTSKVSISYEFRNRTPYAKYIYSDEPSLNTFHPDGFVSAYPHKPVVYRGETKERDNQVTKKKYDRCLSTFKRQLTSAIKKGVNKR